MKTKTVWLAGLFALFLFCPVRSFTAPSAGVADLGVTSTASSFSLVQGQPVTFQWVLTNAGPSNVTSSITVTNFLSAGLQYVSDTSGGAYNSGTRVWTVASLSALGSVAMSLTAATVATGEQTNSIGIILPAGYTDPNMANNTSSAFVGVMPAQANLSLSITPSTSFAGIGQQLILLWTLTNAGPGGISTAISVTNFFSGGLQYVISTGAGSYNSGTGIWTLAGLPASNSASLSVTVKATAAGVQTNTLTVGTSGGGYAMASAFPDVTNSPAPINITCSTNIITSATSSSGAVVFYNVTASGGCSALNIVSTPPSGSAFPIGMTTVHSTASDTCGNSNTCSFTVTVIQTPINITCSTNIITPAASSNGAVVFYNVTASGGCSSLSIVSTPASGSAFPIGMTTVRSTASDICGNSNTCSFTVTVSAQTNTQPQADLAISQTGANPATMQTNLQTVTVTVGQYVVFALQVTNYGPASVPGSDSVTIYDALPAGLQFASANGSSFYTDDNTNWTTDGLLAGGMDSLTLTALAANAGLFTNTAIVSAPGVSDPNLANNTSSVVVAASLPRVVGPPPPAPLLATYSHGQITLTWQGIDFWLQSSGTLMSNSWINVPETPVVVGSTNSLTLPATATAQFFRLVYSLLPPPTGLTLQPEEDDAGDVWFALSWNPVPLANSYNLYYAASPAVTQNNYSSLPGGVVLTGIANAYVTVSNLISGQQYYFVATAVSPVGESADSGGTSGIFSQFASIAGSVSTFLTDGTNQWQEYIQGVSITLSNVDQPLLGAQTVTDPDGSYAFPSQVAGTYQLCWSAPGFIGGCYSQLVVVSNEPVNVDLVLTNNGTGLIYGHVSLADGSVAAETDPFFGIQESVAVGLGVAGQPPIQSVTANSTGDYMMANLPLQTGLSLTASNGAISVVTNVNVTGTQRVDLYLPDTPPQILSLMATSNGVPVTRAPQGTPLQLTIVATNFGGGPLQYNWVPASDITNFVSANSPTVNWTLPNTDGDQVMYVVVSDEGGGYAVARLDISTDLGLLIAGQVVDTNDNPVVGATVSVSGEFTNSDADGNFSLLVTNMTTPYTVQATQPGFFPFSQEFDCEDQGIVCVMVPLPACTPALSTANISLEDAFGSQLFIPSNTLVTSLGGPPQNPVCVTLDTLEPCDTNTLLNGFTTAGIQNGTNVELEFLAMAEVSAEDASGAPLMLSGQPMQLNIADDTNCLADLGGPPPSIAQLWWYDEISAVWRPVGSASASTTPGGGSSFAAQAPQVGVVAVAKANPRIFISLNIDQTISVPVDVRILATATGALVRQDTVGKAPDFLRVQPILVPPEGLTIQVLSPKEAPEVYPPIPNPANKTVIAQVLVPANFANNAPVFIGLSNQITNLPEKRVIGSERFLSFKFGIGSKTSTEAYYNLVDPFFEKTTLTAWQTANGFIVKGVKQTDDAAAFFFNACDLGFGRSMHLKKTAAADGNNDLAFYVSNYPSAADAASNRNLIATVAMDYVLNPATKKRITAFYAYDKAGKLLLSADLDGRGEKFIPNLCLVCHGADKGLFKDLQKGQNPKGDLGARFIPFDQDSYTYSALPNQGQANQTAAFTKLNQAVLTTGPTPSMTTLVQGWYGGPTFPKAFNGSFVPPGWQNTAGNTNIQPAYSGAFVISCRSCHVVRDDQKAFGQFSDLNDDGNVKNIVYNIPAKPMPNALRTFTIFWGSESANIIKLKGPPPDQTSLLQKALDFTGPRPTKFPP